LTRRDYLFGSLLKKITELHCKDLRGEELREMSRGNEICLTGQDDTTVTEVDSQVNSKIQDEMI
jgi:hypothetical protein